VPTNSLHDHQHELLASALVQKNLPILHETAILIADPQVRYAD
jgi:carbon-monoxide dehydrogenase medium subunit